MDRHATNFVLVILIAVAVAISWQEYIIDYDWDSCSYISAVQDGKWFVPLGLGRIGFIATLKTLSYPLEFVIPKEHLNFDSIYLFFKFCQIACFTIGSILFFSLVKKLFYTSTAVCILPFLIFNAPILVHICRIYSDIWIMTLICVLLGLRYGNLSPVHETLRKQEYYICSLRQLVAECICVALLVLIWEQSIYFLSALILPALFAYRLSKKNLLIIFAAPVLGAMLGVIVYGTAYYLSEAYRIEAVHYAFSLYAPTTSIAAIWERFSSLAYSLWYYFNIGLVAFAVGACYLASIRRWDLLAACISLLILSNGWLIFTGAPGGYHFRRMILFLPGLVMGIAAAFHALFELQKVWARVVVAVIITLFLALNPWELVEAYRSRSIATYNEIKTLVSHAEKTQSESLWLLGSMTWLFYVKLKEAGITNHTPLWPSEASMLYGQLRKKFTEALDSDLQVFVLDDPYFYSADQYAQLEDVLERFVKTSDAAGSRIVTLNTF